MKFGYHFTTVDALCTMTPIRTMSPSNSRVAVGLRQDARCGCSLSRRCLSA
jgi:hypothetical protein